MLVLVILTLVALVSGAPGGSERIVGGSLATLSQYPHTVAILHSRNLQTFYQACTGVIITNSGVLTAAHCIHGWPAVAWRTRVGSVNANAGGTVHNTNYFVIHPNYNPYNYDSDVAIIRTVANIAFTPNVAQSAMFASATYNVADNQVVWAAGWGSTAFGAQQSEQLRHVQMWAINQNTCRLNYAARNRNITENMICAGNLGAGGRDQCLGDEGGPLLHNGNVVGIASWIGDCGIGQFPAVNTRISRFITWIQSHF